MAAPSATARGTPAGKPLQSGHSTKITIALNPTISFWEKTVSGGGVNTGDKIDITTMFNTRYATFAPQPLLEPEDITATCAYDPNVLTQLNSVAGVETTLTVTHPDGSTEAWYGFIMSAVRGENTRGEQPTIEVTFGVSNWDASNDVEAGPTVVSVSGT